MHRRGFGGAANLSTQPVAAPEKRKPVQPTSRLKCDCAYRSVPCAVCRVPCAVTAAVVACRSADKALPSLALVLTL